MIAQPDETSVHAFLGRAARRLTWVAAAEGAAAGFVAAALIAIAGWPARGALTSAVVVGATLAVAGIGIGVSRARRKGVAALVERRAPQCRNVVITADELRTL